MFLAPPISPFNYSYILNVGDYSLCLAVWTQLQNIEYDIAIWFFSRFHFGDFDLILVWLRPYLVLELYVSC